MIKFRPSFVAPLASIMILVLGAGFFTTLTTLDLAQRGVDKWIIGCVSSAFFCGLLISAFWSQHFIARVGHIRAFASFATTVCVVAILQGLFFSPTLWVILRFLAGYSLAGVMVVVESWLLDGSDEKDRGALLAIYMFGYYFAQGMSQLFLTIGYTREIGQYCLIGIFAALSILPVCMTRFEAPAPAQPNILPFQYLIKLVPLGVWGCFISGMILGPIYSLLPDYLYMNEKSDSEVGLIMMSIILGGMCLQYPIGRLSDKLDRRRVLLGVGLASVVIFILFIPDYYATLWLVILGFLLGGTTFTIYPLSISHTIDHIQHSDMLSAVSTLLLAYGAGSALGPLIAPIFSKLFGDNGICYYLLAMGIVFTLFTLRYLIFKTPYQYDEHVDFVGLPSTTPVTSTESEQKAQEEND